MFDYHWFLGFSIAFPITVAHRRLFSFHLVHQFPARSPVVDVLQLRYGNIVHGLTFEEGLVVTMMLASERNANVNMRLFPFSTNAGQHDYVHVAVIPS